MEDFTTYIKSDPTNVITKTSSKVQWDSLVMTANTYVYKDKGVNHFNKDFTHTFKVKIANGGIDAGNCAVWFLANIYGTGLALETAEEPYVVLIISGPGAEGKQDIGLLFHESYSPDYYSNDYSIPLDPNSLYYITIVYDKETGNGSECKYTAYICTDNYYGQSGATLIDTLEVLGNSFLTPPDWRYIQPCSNAGGGFDTYYRSDYIEDLELNEPTGFIPQVIMI